MAAPVLVKTKRVGGSLMVTIPKTAVETFGIEEGETVELTVRPVRKDHFGALRGIGAFSHADHADHA